VRSALWYCILAWVFGACFFTIITGGAFNYFLTKYLHTSDSTYGWITSLGSLAVVLQLYGSYVVERTGRSKRMFLIFCTLHRLIWLGIAAIPLLMPVRGSGPAMGQTFIACLVVLASAAASNYGAAGWTSWMADIVPQSSAGKFFGIRSGIGLSSMVLTAFFVPLLLDRYAASGWIYSVIFGVAALVGATDILLFVRVREIPRAVEATLPSFLELAITPWRDRLFRLFTLYTVVSWIGYAMMGNYMWRYCFDAKSAQGLGLSNLMTNIMLAIIPMAMMAVMAPSWGRAIDCFGPRPVLATSSLCHALLPIGWALVHPSIFWLVPVLALLSGITWPGIDQANFYMQIQIFPENRRTAYIAMFTVVVGVATLIGTVWGGYYATFWQTALPHLAWAPAWMSHYQPVFLTATVIRLIALFWIMPYLPLEARGGHAAVAQTIAKDVVNSVANIAVVKGKRRREKARSEE
jgi:MFS family permease